MGLKMRESDEKRKKEREEEVMRVKVSQAEVQIGEWREKGRNIRKKESKVNKTER